MTMKYTEEPIAVIGSGCRFPGGSSSPSKLWDLIKDPRDVASKIHRFSAEGFYNKDGHHHGTSNVLHSYQLEEDPRVFDAQFFNIAGSEADSIDPQQRVLLEVVYEALEASGHKIEELSGSSTAVYVGVMCNDYAHITYHDLESLPKYAATGTALSILSNRVSYYFNWTGPSMTIDTACSSSLIATHQAVQALRRGDSNLAVAAGANLIFGPTNYVAESNLNMLSPTGRSRMWDSKADGYARGEGVAAVILKRLSDAIADGDIIDCIIRETGANQDGRTPGITMPSSTAQANLIRQTYQRAGLDVQKDRCQYFEAHGTGTKAGDPQEAGAIYKAFFSDSQVEDANDKLYVGSIKTVIGHTEGTAGLAGLLRAGLAVKHGVIPPNMLLEELNPDVLPYYGRLEILKSAQAWPELPAGVPRRASVNSFGFGGANAHAIIEAYEPEKVENALSRSSNVSVPFMFSSNSEKTLITQLETFLAHIETLDEDSTNLRDLAWTLSRRSAFSLRASYSASSLQDLRTKLSDAIDAKKNDGSPIGERPSHKTHQILGIFTGQGAQWPRMGYMLVESSPFAASILRKLDSSLQELPEQDRPAWTLEEELSKSADDSHVMEGAYSQPLCAAVQVILIELLKEAGITFDVVVGHSSGEIGAAYAAGFLTARDAVRIAYYRGLFGKLAGGAKGASGSMLAVGTSMEDATELCELATMKKYGRFNVAASNSSSSVTMSGDQAAIERAKFIFEDESKFVRALKVDTAYHSHHMEPCSEPYMDAMARVGIEIQEPNPSCRWYSSVLGGDLVTSDMKEKLAGSYWKDNLLQPVLFSQALESALKTNGAPAIALEVGPHPALKGPASMVIEETLGTSVPYLGVLARNSDDVGVFSGAIGSLWANVGALNVDFARLDAAFVQDSLDKPQFLRSVPGYTWEHNQVFWTESRLSKAMRLRQDEHHELLGVRIDSGENERRWRNFLKPNEIPWVRGHQIQGQTVFPGAGFASMAIEATKAFVSDAGAEIELIEVEDLTIRRGLGFVDEITGAEVTITLSNIQRDETANIIHCDFVCGACPSKDAAPTTISTARITIRLGCGSPETLPPREPASEAEKMTDVDADIFYSSLSKQGYNYADMFKSITTLSRRKLTSSGVIHTTAEEGYKSDLIVHPAPLDVAFQGMFGAIGAPGDGQLWTLMVPTVIKSIKVNPFMCSQTACLETDLSFDARAQVDKSTNKVAGDIDVYDINGNAMLQIEGLYVTPLTQAGASDDAQKFTQTVYAPEKPDAARQYTEFWKSDLKTWDKGCFVERVCFHYMKLLHDAIPIEEREELAWHPKKYITWATSVVESVKAGTHPIVKQEWLDDSLESLDEDIKAFTLQYDDFQLVKMLGDNLIAFVKGEVSLLELFRDSDVLDQVYKRTYGVPEYNIYIGDLVKQLSHKHQQMEILEIGAGTGSATEGIMNQIGDHFGSYTFTDISASFFPDAQNLFKKHEEKFIYKTLNVETDPTEQGFSERRYDLIIASNVLHATKSINNTLSNVRRLLKPGGRLVLLEITDTDPVRQTFFFGALPGWWVGEEDGREHHPLLRQQQWDEALLEAGFSGIDTATPETGMFIVPLSVMMSQAIDTQMQLIREPLDTENNDAIELPKLLLLAGQAESTSDLQSEIISVLEPFAGEIEIVSRLEDLDESHFGPKQLVLSLMELDTHVFSPFTAERWSAIQLLVENSASILWLTRGINGENPFSNMMNGVARCLVHEKPDLRFQLVDFPVDEAIDTAYVASLLLRMHVSSTWKNFLEPYNTTWMLEREIRIENGQEVIPRMLPCDALDARYNASRRTIRKQVDIKQSVVTITNDNCHFELKEVTAPSWSIPQQTNTVEVETLQSTLLALRIPSVGSLHLLIGKIAGTEKKVLAFSETLQSKLSVPRDLVFEVDVSDDETQKLLASAVNYLLGAYLLSNVTTHTSLLVHEPMPSLAVALQELSGGLNVALSLTTSSTGPGAAAGLKYIHPRAHKRTVLDSLPANISAFAYFSKSEDSAQAGTHVEKYLPTHISRIAPESFLCNSIHSKPQTESAYGLLQNAYGFFEAHSELDYTERVQEFSLENISGHALDKSQFNIDVLNFSPHSEPLALAKLSTAEDIVQFRADKTYWLAGLTGELGLSLTAWMIERGARYIVLTSRNPKINPKWLDAMQSTGATVLALPMDITDPESVCSVHKTITDTLPPIAGVCNGAMVLNDGLIAKQSYKDFNATLEPKVKGTQHLDSLFSKPDLDFFIVFSSLAYTTGNIGQASYAAANGFMKAVVEGRRRRGLAGSVMNLAGIYGIGYITRREATLMDRLEKMGYSNISEWDYLQFFAEAVLAGRPDKTSPHKVWEISSAIRRSDPDSEDQPPWLEIPRFSWYKTVRGKAADREDGAVASVREQLKEQTNMEDVKKVLLAGFVGNLYKLLGMRAEDNVISPSTSLIELGIDSLVAVDMKIWFTRELDLDLPVLKLLGGATVEDMVEDAVSRLSPALIPNVKDGSQGAAEAPAASSDPETSDSSDDSETEPTESAPTTPALSVKGSGEQEEATSAMVDEAAERVAALTLA